MVGQLVPILQVRKGRLSLLPWRIKLSFPYKAPIRFGLNYYYITFINKLDLDLILLLFGKFIFKNFISDKRNSLESFSRQNSPLAAISNHRLHV